MPLQFSVTLRNNQADQVESTVGTSPILRIYNGTPPANVGAALSGNTLLAQGTLPSDWLTAASSGSKTINNGPWTLTGQSGAGSGTAGTFFRIFESTGTTAHIQGTFGVGQDMVPDNNSIANGPPPPPFKLLRHPATARSCRLSACRVRLKPVLCWYTLPSPAMCPPQRRLHRPATTTPRRLPLRSSSMFAPRHWFIQLTIALNQLANVLITPFSSGAWADETMSSRAWRMWVQGKPFGRIFRPLIDGLFFWQRVPPEFHGHCHWTYERERQKYQQPPEMR